MSHRLPAWQPARPPLSHIPIYQHHHIGDLIIITHWLPACSLDTPPKSPSLYHEISRMVSAYLSATPVYRHDLSLDIDIIPSTSNTTHRVAATTDKVW